MSQSLLPIHTIAGKLNLPEEYFEPIGRHGAKLKLDILSDPAFPCRGKLILVTAIVLASTAAQAAGTRGLITLASTDRSPSVEQTNPSEATPAPAAQTNVTPVDAPDQRAEEKAKPQ